MIYYRLSISLCVLTIRPEPAARADDKCLGRKWHNRNRRPPKGNKKCLIINARCREENKTNKLMLIWRCWLPSRGKTNAPWQWQNQAAGLTMMEVTTTMALNDRRMWMWWHCRVSGASARGFRGGSSCGSCSLTRHSWRDLSTGIIRLPLRLRLPVMLELRRSSFMTTTMMMRSTPFVYQISMRWYVHVCNDVMEVAYHHERCLCAQLGWISLNYYCTLFIFIYLWYHNGDFMIFYLL